MVRQTIEWIDAAKGFAMLLIIWDHVFLIESPLKLWLTSFHVPLFLVLTGFLLDPATNNKTNGKTLINKLLRSYISFSIIAIVCLLLYDLSMRGSKESVHNAIINTYKTVTGFGIGAIWFIPSYFIARYVDSKTMFLPYATQFTLLIIWAGIGILGSVLFTYLRTIIASSVVYDAIYYLGCAIMRGLTCTFYLVIGRLVFILTKQLYNRNNYLFIVGITSLTCLLLSLYFSRYLSGSNFSLLRFGHLPYIIYLCGTFGSIGVIGLFFLFHRIYSLPVLQYIGRNSLIIMGTHMSLLLPVLIPSLLGLWFSIPQQQTIGYHVFVVSCVVIIVLIEIPVISLLNGRLSFLIRSNRPA